MSGPASPTQRGQRDVGIQSLADASAFALSDERLERLLGSIEGRPLTGEEFLGS